VTVPGHIQIEVIQIGLEQPTVVTLLGISWTNIRYESHDKVFTLACTADAHISEKLCLHNTSP